ncbi:MAG: AI-2E family transporter [Clostridia bacterium]|nr:AI-2E family transporter [Clostridia bacterium]
MIDGVIRRHGRAIGIALAILGGLLFCRFFAGRVLAALLPFLFAFLAARLTLRPARWLAKKTRLPVGAASVVLTLLLVFSFGFGIFLLLRQVIVECGAILSDTLSDPSLPARIAAAVENLSAFVRSHIPGGAGGPLLSEEDLSGIVRNGFSSLVSSFSRLLGGILSRVPSFFFAQLVSVVAAVWVSSDPDGLHRLSNRLIPPLWRERVERLRRGFFRGVGTVFYAYGILFLVTFFLLLAGLSLLRVPYALLLSLLVALFDLLPVLGAGGILVPWGIFSVVSGRGAFGACLFALSLVIFIVRQILTPRLVGRGLGIHPLLAFFSVSAGYKLAGAAGVVAGLILSALGSRALSSEGAPDMQ